MMIFDHIAFGILTSNTSKNRLYFSIVVFSIICTILPDIPAFIYPPTTIGYFSHRAYTHSIFLAFIYSLIPIGVYQIISRRYSMKEFFLIYIFSLIAFLSHILLDVATTFGTNLLFPFSREIFSFDIFLAFDPVFMLISFFMLIVFIYFIKNKQQIPAKLVLLYVFLILGYTTFTLLARNNYTKKFKNYLVTNNKQIVYLKTVPRTFWRWKGIACDSTNYYVIRNKKDDFEIKKYHKYFTPLKIIAQDKYYKEFISYARFPAQIIHGDTISYVNLIYSPDSYKVSFIIDKHKNIIRKSISSFDLFDKNL